MKCWARLRCLSSSSRPYPDRLLTGEKPEPAFLITKPYQPDTVKAIVSQALFFEQRARRKD